MNKKTVYIIHGWGGSPSEPLHLWLKKELEGNGYNVIAPEMPNTEEPHIKEWVNKTKEIAKTNAESIFVGHSIGCQAIFRFLSDVPEGQKIAGAVLMAPWIDINMKAIEEEGQEAVAIASEWTSSKVNLAKVKEHINGSITAIFSSNDPFVLPKEREEIFTKELGAKIIVENNKGHFREEDGW